MNNGPHMDDPGAAPPFDKDTGGLVGMTLGDYLVTSKIAKGGMGEVYLAVQKRLNRKVALKVLSPHLAEQASFLHRFEREAHAAAALNHPGIVQVYDFGEAGGQHYLAMEYVDGPDLADYVIERGKLTVDAALGIVEEAARALQAAAAVGIIHRDIKPSNLMLARGNRVKVSDLGLAKNVNEDVEVTATGIGMGSPLFIAPEQANNARHVDHRADIYSLGITLLYLLTGKYPFEGGTAFAVVLAHAQKPLPTGEELGTPLPDRVEALIRNMAAKQVEDRYVDYDALLADLALVKSGAMPAKRAPSDASQPSSGPRGSSLVLLTAAIIVLLLVVFSIFYFRPKPASAPPAVVSSPAQPLGPSAASAPRDPAGAPRTDTLPPRPADRGGSDVSSSFPRPASKANRASLTDGPVNQMMADADAYAAKYPTNYIIIVDLYAQVKQKASGTPLGPKADEKFQDAVLAHQFAVFDAMEDFKKRSQDLLQQGQPEKARQIWQTFPQNLRMPEVDQQIQKVMNQLFSNGGQR